MTRSGRMLEHVQLTLQQGAFQRQGLIVRQVGVKKDRSHPLRFKGRPLGLASVAINGLIRTPVPVRTSAGI